VEPSLEKKLDELMELTTENNRMLHRMRRVQRWAAAMRALYWLLIIGLAFGSFYFVKPYFEQLTKVYTQGAANFSTIQTEFSNIQSFFGKGKSDTTATTE
jgi:hypothetical protein